MQFQFSFRTEPPKMTAKYQDKNGTQLSIRSGRSRVFNPTLFNLTLCAIPCTKETGSVAFSQLDF